MLIAIINRSSISDDQIILMTRAIQIQVSLHLLPAFNLKRTDVKFYTDLKKIPGHAWVICLTNDNTNDVEIQKEFQDNNDSVNSFIYCQPILDSNDSVSAALSQEVCEMITNRFANIWVTGPATSFGSEYAYNICEAVDNNDYVINVDGTDIKVANFVFPSFFNMSASKEFNMPFDYLKILSAPFTTCSGNSLTIRKPSVDLNIKTDERKRHGKNKHRRRHSHH